jgi:Polyketide cyclase / dehydrase and lipid transport
MWSTQASSTSSAKPEAIFALYADFPNWKRWDTHLIATTLQGAFEAGGIGTLHPVGALAPMPFTLLAVSQNQGFTDSTQLPGATVVFTHTLEPTFEGTRITHRCEIIGEAWERYVDTLGAGIAERLPSTVANLAKLAETQSM